jgi:hypothetical protein
MTKNPKEAFEQQQKYDELKREFCKKNGIPLIEVPEKNDVQKREIIETALKKIDLISQDCCGDYNQSSSGSLF